MPDREGFPFPFFTFARQTKRFLCVLSDKTATDIDFSLVPHSGSSESENFKEPKPGTLSSSSSSASGSPTFPSAC